MRSLFSYKQLIDKEGFKYFEKLLKQDIKFVRGSSAAEKELSTDKYSIGLGLNGPIEDDAADDESKLLMLLDKDIIFSTVIEYVAIPQTVKNVNSAKLYVNWLLSKSVQGKYMEFSIRDDIVAKNDKHISEYNGKNTELTGFNYFAEDEGNVERFLNELEIYINDACAAGNESPIPGQLGGNPVAEKRKGKGRSIQKDGDAAGGDSSSSKEEKEDGESKSK